MPKNVVVPKLGPAIDAGLLVAWHVNEGVFVKRGTPLYAVETDKSIVDCESMEEGYLQQILVQEGATVHVDQVLAVLSEEAPTRRIAEPPIVVRNAPDVSRVRISPRARKMARATGVEIELLAGGGSGPEGRIVQRDVEALITRSVAGGASGDAGRRAAPVSRTGKTTDVPLSSMRRAIARRLTESALQIPVFHTTVKIEADALVALRQQLERGRGLKVRVNDILVKACALALKKFPQINATYHGDFVRLHEAIDISVAVAVEDGLFTPIVHDADQKSVAEISATLTALAAEARAGGLAPEAYQGGTFTVSNLGMYGVEAFTAIINPPQCAILAVGAIDREVRFEAGVARECAVMRATLSADHRAIDGALAAGFLGELKALLENPACVMLS